MAKGIVILLFSLILLRSIGSVYSTRVDSSIGKIQEEAYNSMAKAKDSADNAVDSVKDKAKDAGETVKDKANKVSGAAGDAVETVKDKAKQVPGAAADAAEIVKGKVKQVPKAAADAADTVKDKAKKVPKAANDAAETVKDKAKQVPGAAVDATESVKDKMKQVPKAANGAAESVKDKAKQAARDFAGSVKHKGEQMEYSPGNAIGSMMPEAPSHAPGTKHHKHHKGDHKDKSDADAPGDAPKKIHKVTSHAAVDDNDKGELPDTGKHTYNDVTGTFKTWLGSSHGQQKKPSNPKHKSDSKTGAPIPNTRVVPERGLGMEEVSLPAAFYETMAPAPSPYGDLTYGVEGVPTPSTFAAETGDSTQAANGDLFAVEV